MKYTITLKIRDKDIDGNKIDTVLVMNKILKGIKKFWNVEEISIGSQCVVCKKNINDLQDENAVEYKGKKGFMCKKCFTK